MAAEHDFVHLHVHTEFSLLDGLSRIPQLVSHAQEMGMPALAITDHGTMYGVIDFYRAAKKSGIKPIIGLEAYITGWGHSRFERSRDAGTHHLLLLAKNQTGYLNLLKIASAAQLEGFYNRPRVDHEFLEQHAEGLIATSGCLAAEIPRLVERGQEEEARRRMGWFQDVFGRENFFLELQHHQIPELHTFNRWLQENQGYVNSPFVATNDVHYVFEDDYDIHDTLLCIQTGKVKAEQNRLRFSGPTFHLRSPEEMWALFGEVPESLTNTLLIAEMCDVDLDHEGYHLPKFPVPEGYTPQTYLRYLCERGLAWRYGEHANDSAILQRLDHELGIIHEMGFDTYFLIVWDLCEFARHRDIWWNVRGSGAGSLTAYALGITNLDPLDNDLIFERFLNPGRVSMPDIDLDYPEDRRAEMIQYCAQKYGEDKVAAIITFGTMGSKAAIRDVGRALDYPLPEVDRIARLIPSTGKAIKFEDALGDDTEKAIPELKEAYRQDPVARELIDTARKLEGITRHASTHAAGVIVADKPLVEYIPLHRPTKGSDEDAPVKVVTQFPMATCESMGLLKVDFLGLSTLTIMRRACEMIEANHGIHYDLSNIPYSPDPNDPEKTRMVEEMFALIGRGETVGVFQLESQGMRRMLTDMRPSRFEHIVAAVALYRPGPMENIPSYNRRLRGEEPITYKHPKLKPILEETYGIIVYQEQIMRIGAELFGYSLGEADLMRKAVSKKKKKDLLKHRQIFLERGPEYGVDEKTAEAIFDDIEYFARYGFNKSHAADYAVLTCQTAFLKCHYPHEYMAALMSVHRDDSAKVSLFAADCHRMGIPVLPPTVNDSQLDFSIEQLPDGTRAIRFGLGAIKNIGEAPLLHVLEARGEDGPFRDLDDFCRRVDARTVNRRAMESLIKVGALDKFGERPKLLAAADRIVNFSVAHHKAQDVGQLSLFGEATGVQFGAEESILAQLQDVDPVPKREMLNWEKDLVGLYVTEHPLQALWAQLEQVITITSAEMAEAGETIQGKGIVVAGLVTEIRRLHTRKGAPMAVLTVEDITGTFSAVLFPRTWKRYQEIVDEDAVLILRGKADASRGDVQIIVDSVAQEAEIAMAADEREPDLPSASFSWVEDTPSPQTAAVAPPRSGNGHRRAPQASAPTGAVSAPPPPSAEEMPGWLAAEDFDREVPLPPPDWDPVRELPPAPKPSSAEQTRPSPAEAQPIEVEPEPAMTPEPSPEPSAPRPPHMLTLVIRRTGDLAQDRKRVRRLHAYLTQYPGQDRFRFELVGKGQRALLDFPNDAIEINDDVLDFAERMLGAESIFLDPLDEA